MGALDWTVAALTLGLAAGCGSDVTPQGSTSGICIPGQTFACACPGGAIGVQTCETDGRSVGPCAQCAGAGGATSTSSGSAGAGAAQGDGAGGAATTTTTTSTTTGPGSAPDGEPCAQDAQCASTHCESGVCCFSTCDAPCTSCLGAHNGSADGVCGYVVFGQDPWGECLGTDQCDGMGQCWHPGTGPSLLSCVCNDIALQTCAAVDCDSGLAADEVCGPLCLSYGGTWGTGCFPSSPSCP